MILKDKVAIITGGADGIGAGLSRAFVREGAKVVIVDIQPEKGIALEQELGAAARFLCLDLREPDMAERVLDFTRSAFGDRLDVLVNNAQASGAALILDVDQELLDRTFATGLWATWSLMRACHSLLTASQGSIVNFASGAGLLGMPMQAAYAMNKEAIRGLTRVAANEWGAQGIRVNVVCPGARTPGYEQWAARYPERAQAGVAMVPLGRIGDVEADIAPIVVFLASDASRYMTGQTLMADGGALMLR